MKPRKVLAIASGGGHFVQLLRLRPAWDGMAVAYATVDPSSRLDVGGAPFHTFRDSSRADGWRAICTVIDMAGILLKERPDVIVTTGALPGLIACALGRLLGARTLWVDSIANSEVISTSGKHARRIAHQVVTQWPQLAEPGVDHWGSVL